MSLLLNNRPPIGTMGSKEAQKRDEVLMKLFSSDGEALENNQFKNVLVAVTGSTQRET